MSRTLILICVIGIIGATQILSAEKLPYQQATGVTDSNGKRILKYWSASNDLHPEMSERYLPDNPAFDGAEVWHIGVRANTLEDIAVGAFTQAGMSDVKLLAHRDGNPIAVAAAASQPQIKMTAVMVEGTLNGKPAQGIGYAFYGLDDDIPGVSAFMAPADVFVALGGHLVPEVHWYLGTTEADHDLIAEGRLSPQQQVDEASLFFSEWVLAYVISLKGIQQQSLQMMQSWSNAMNVCAGDPSCTVSPSADGSGNWEPTISHSGN
ncbi:MAG: hypothetical protein AAFO81_01195 [Pseudomonadota bacterium]